jgi:cytochrome P450
MLGEGLMTSEGESWFEQRHLIQPAFHRERIDAFSSAIAQTTQARLEGWKSVADRQLQEQIFTLLMAGHETTAKALTWTLYLLDRYPSVAKQLQEELAAVLEGHLPTLVDLPNLPYTYLPFSGGPRQCIGHTLARVETHLVLATLAQQYQLRLVPNHPVEPEALVTLRSRLGMPMTVYSRASRLET